MRYDKRYSINIPVYEQNDKEYVIGTVHVQFIYVTYTLHVRTDVNPDNHLISSSFSSL